MIYNDYIVKLVRNKMAKRKSFGGFIIELFFGIIILIIVWAIIMATYFYFFG